MVIEMARKHALIVDDSQTAREVLAKRLAGYDIEVDTVESAGDAIDYLSEHIPDAVFLDYEMPGMDGFQALKAIKSNPNTAAIPVMMYTSRAGGLAIGQARALGALGVLPKELATQDLDEVIQVLHLNPDQDSLVARYTHAVVGSGNGGDEVRADAEYIDRFQGLVEQAEQSLKQGSSRKQMALLLAQQHKLLSKNMDENASRFLRSIEQQFSEVNERLNDTQRSIDASLPKKRGIPKGLLMVFVACLAISATVWFWNINSDRTQRDVAENLLLLESGRNILTEKVTQVDVLIQQQQTAIETLKSSLEDLGKQVGTEAVPLLEWAVNRDSRFPYGEGPFSDKRVIWLSQIIDHLAAAGFTGTVRLTANYGNYCLSRNDQSRFVPASVETAFADCVLARDLAETEGKKQAVPTIGFSNYLNNAPSLINGDIFIELEASGFDATKVPYPEPYAVQDVGVWNQVASQNQRIDIKLFVAE